jgi:hypothetical protein
MNEKIVYLESCIGEIDFDESSRQTISIRRRPFECPPEVGVWVFNPGVASQNNQTGDSDAKDPRQVKPVESFCKHLQNQCDDFHDTDSIGQAERPFCARDTDCSERSIQRRPT